MDTCSLERLSIFLLSRFETQKVTFHLLMSIGGSLAADQFKAIHDEGMPQYQRPFQKGSLYVHFNVEFPEPGSLNFEQIKVKL
jgi:DnaJ-class molecular chaperone